VLKLHTVGVSPLEFSGKAVRIRSTLPESSCTATYYLTTPSIHSKSFCRLLVEVLGLLMQQYQNLSEGCCRKPLLSGEAARIRRPKQSESAGTLPESAVQPGSSGNSNHTVENSLLEQCSQNLSGNSQSKSVGLLTSCAATHSSGSILPEAFIIWRSGQNIVCGNS
jgi:hypothetical protein